jgi:hypothetical protein
MKVRFFAVAGSLLVIVAFGLVSCSSLPLPDTPEQSLLLIPCGIHLEGMRDKQARTIALDLVIRRVKDGREITVHFDSGKNYAVVALDPGGYEFTKLLVRREWISEGRSTNSWTETRNTSRISFFIADKIVRWYEGLLSFRDLSNGKYSYSISTRNSSPASAREKILSAMKKDPHWLGWEGYELINFTVP